MEAHAKCSQKNRTRIADAESWRHRYVVTFGCRAGTVLDRRTTYGTKYQDSPDEILELVIEFSGHDDLKSSDSEMISIEHEVRTDANQRA